MRLKEEINLEALESYGFEKIDKEEAERLDDFTLQYFEYSYNLGHSRRGQFYYILVDKRGGLSLYASKPDGDGTSIALDMSIIFKLLDDGLIYLKEIT